MFNIKGGNLRKLAAENSVIIMFSILCVAGIFASRLTLDFVIREILTRFGRNTFLVLSLIIPVIAGMGLNFGIVIGAMAAQMALIWVTHMQMSGITGILAAVLVATPIGAISGYLAGMLLNKMKGQEMVGSLFLGYFTAGIYQFIMLAVVGGIVPLKNTALLISGGKGVKNTIDLKESVSYGIDNIIQVPAALFFNALLIIMAVSIIIRYFINKKKGLMPDKNKAILSCLLCGLGVLVVLIPKMYYILYYAQIPLVTFTLILGLILFNRFFLNTRLGQNMRTVGQSRPIANAAGLKVDKIRIIAIIISTVFASWGQIISLQNLGTIQTYSSHEQVGLFAVASLLVGGASVHKASNAQAVIGVILFHTLFIIAPFAGKNLFNNAQIGEYFRVAVAYGVICVSLMMYAMKTLKAANKQ